jgi:hypothetical protein
MRKILIVFILLLAACRSITKEVSDANVESNSKSTELLKLWEERILPKVNTGEQYNLEELNNLTKEWSSKYAELVSKRNLIQSYLDSNSGDADTALGFQTASVLISDINKNILQIFSDWQSWLSLDDISGKEQYIVFMKLHVERFNTLNRKFNDWVSQFKVK